MPRSNCSRCGSTQFEAVHANDLKGINRSIVFIQCEKCGAVIGVVDFVNLGVQAMNLREDVSRVISNLRRDFRR